MAISSRVLQDRFRGCLLGLAVGDALGGHFEAQSAERILARFPSIDSLMNFAQEPIWYTDDTEMTIGVCEALLQDGVIEENTICRAFVANYNSERGYGRGARAVLEAMESAGDYRAVAERHFPGGSFGNGAAMRVAPVGLLFRDSQTELLEQARKSALPTHTHPLGIEGAQILALAIGLVSAAEDFDRKQFLSTLSSAAKTEEFQGKLNAALRSAEVANLAELGNGIQAIESVVTAIAVFAKTPESYDATIANAIFLGGDTDTIAAMAGALSGAYLGSTKLPSRLVALLEDTQKGGRYISSLADRLFEKYCERCSA